MTTSTKRVSMNTKVLIHGLTINVGANDRLPVFLGELNLEGVASTAAKAIDAKALSDDGLTVYDPATRLTWHQAGSDKKMRNDGPAEDYIAKLNAEKFGGISTWRQPNDHELCSIVDRTRRDPAIDPIFACKSDWYWTNQPYIESNGSSSGYAWIVAFYDGSVGDLGRDLNAFVRAVSGPSPAGQ